MGIGHNLYVLLVAPTTAPTWDEMSDLDLMEGMRQNKEAVVAGTTTVQ